MSSVLVNRCLSHGEYPSMRDMHLQAELVRQEQQHLRWAGLY